MIGGLKRSGDRRLFLGTVGFVAVLLCGLTVTPVALADSGPAAPTVISGGLTSAPTALPTSFDPAKFDFTGICTEQWTGTWTGASTCTVDDAHYDQATGQLTAHATDRFVGVFMTDHSHGSITMDETFVGNVVTGGGVLTGRIVGGDGDPTFRCSSGRISIPLFFLNAAGGFGGYVGTWSHGCGNRHGHASARAHAEDASTGMPGGIISAPTGVPTSGDPSTFDFSGFAPENWFGTLTGVSKGDIKSVHVNPATGDVEGHIVDSFVGVDIVDHSHGSLTIDETFTGNVFTGAGLIEGTIVASDGDPTFRCLSGHLVMPLYLNAAASFGGYEGLTTDGCPS